MGIIVVNFKAYRESVGRNAVELAKKICSRRFDGVHISAAVQPSDISGVSMIMPVLAQHVDAADFGAFTGHFIPEAAKESGAEGVVINHSEMPLDLKTIEKTIARSKSCGLKTLVCAATPEMVSAVSFFNPDIISIEPPALIGTGKASSQFMPGIISGAVKGSRGIPLICGAGIAAADDVRKAVELGCAGIMLSSAVVKSEKPEEKIKELAEGLSGK
ncbi:MAG: triose-phosphate isomerase [Candidatus Aenigmarchaeota archaeon]|nr:triose-phosphate isomerase [Candidatus Aenigmarchaeota archaeon]